VKFFAFCLLVLTVGVANAQQLPNSASSSKNMDSMAVARMADAPPAAGHSTMGAHRGEASLKAVADRKFWAVTGMMTASTITATELTSRCEVAGSCKFMGPFDSRAKLYGIGLPVNFGMMELTYRLKRSGKRYWFVPAVAGTAFNTIVAVHSADKLK
jgi:hypothetical protein